MKLSTKVLIAGALVFSLAIVPAGFAFDQFVYWPDDNFTIPNTNIDLDDDFQFVKHTVTFNPNGGIVLDGSASLSVGHNQPIDENLVPTVYYDDKVFGYWYQTPEEGAFNFEDEAITSNITLFAFWFGEPVPSITTGSITFTGLPGENQAITPSVALCVENNIDVINMTKSGDVYGASGNNRLRFASGSNPGSITIEFAEELNIESVDLTLTTFNETDKPDITVSAGVGVSTSPSIKMLTGGSTSITKAYSDPSFVLNTKSDWISISSAKSKRFYLSQIDVHYYTSGTVVVPPSPIEATVSLGSSINGTIVISPSGPYLAGDTVTVTATPNATYKTSNVQRNGMNGTKVSNDIYTFVLEGGLNTFVPTFVSVGSVTGDFVNMSNVTLTPSRGSQSVSYDDYYESVRGKSGIALRNSINDIISGHTAYSYDSAGAAFTYMDADPFVSGNVYGFYQGSITEASARTKISREHVWAKSHGSFDKINPMNGDYHNLRICHTNMNTTRGNNDFGIVSGGTDLGTGGYSWSASNMIGNKVGNNLFEPKDEFKGDAARIIFYMAARYDGENGESDLEVNQVVGSYNTSLYYDYTSGASGLHGNFSDLYQWNIDDPVSDYELHRNNVIDQKYQHNRNPFIDHPEFIIMIYSKAYTGSGALNHI